jgi:hypothetical protein
LVVVCTPGTFDAAVRHELVHARLTQRRSGSVPMFREGLAEAIEAPGCRPKKLPRRDPQELLLVEAADLQFSGRLVAGELVAWLLEAHGPAVVLDFLASLQRSEFIEHTTPPDEVRASYREHFGSEYDEDLNAHVRKLGGLPAEAFGCMGPRVSASDGRLRLESDLDCSSARVQNDFRVPGRVFVTWQLEVPTQQRYVLSTPLAADARLSIKRCGCNLAFAEPRVSWAEDSVVGSQVELAPGRYQVRLLGPVDHGLAVELAVEPAP